MANRANLIDAEVKAQHPGATVKRRGRTFIEHDLGGGVTRWTGTIEPLHTRSGTTSIDTTFVADAGAWQWKLAQADFEVHARSVLNAGDVVQWLDPVSGQSVTLQPLALNWVDNVTDSRQQITQPQAVTAVANDCALYWPNGYGTGRHFRYTAHPKRLIKEFIIDAAANLPAPTVSNPYLEVEFVLKASTSVELFIDGVQWDRSTKTSTAHSIEFRVTATGKTAWLFEAPSAHDAAEHTTPGIMQLRRSGATRYVTVRFPKAWIDAATFPIVLDPTLTLQPDAAAGKDGYMRYQQSSYNYGVAADISVGENNTEANGFYRGLIQFDLSSIPADATIDSATFTGVLIENGNFRASNNRTLNLYRMKRAWTEGTGSNSTTGDGATWTTYNGVNNWQIGGAGGANDAEAGTIGSCAFATTDASGASKAFTLTAALVKEWIDGTLTNNGMKCQAGTETDDRYAMGSSDNATAGNRPQLVVNYTTAAGNPWYVYAQQ